MKVKLFPSREEGFLVAVHARPGLFSARLRKFRKICQNLCLSLAAFLTLALSQAAQAGEATFREGKDAKSAPLAPVDWREFAISPVGNPIFFEDPRIETGARLIFLYNRVGDDFGLNLGGTKVNLGGADIFAYGAQLRWAVTPRLAIIATNNVGISFRPDNPIPGTAFDDADGYSDLDVGIKYALIDLPAQQFLLTPILTYGFRPVAETFSKMTIPASSTWLFLRRKDSASFI